MRRLLPRSRTALGSPYLLFKEQRARCVNVHSDPCFPPASRIGLFNSRKQAPPVTEDHRRGTQKMCWKSCFIAAIFGLFL